jgi:hypothetical protein
MSNGIMADNPSLGADWSLFRRRSAADINGRLHDVMNATTDNDRIKEMVQNLSEGVKRLEDASRPAWRANCSAARRSVRRSGCSPARSPPKFRISISGCESCGNLLMFAIMIDPSR